MNRFDAFIIDYLYENKEVALEKIGTIKTTFSDDPQQASIEFTCNKRISTSPGLVDYISEKANKNRHLISSDLESHFAQVREFINIGKSYELPQIGFIKAKNSGVYEYIPYSEVNKPVKTSTQPHKEQKRTNNRSIIQLITFLIVLAILTGIGWQAYQFFRGTKGNKAAETIKNNSDTANNNVSDTTAITANTVVKDSANTSDSSNVASTQPAAHTSKDSVNVRYVFETTASILRATARTAQLKTFGNNAGYDSFVNDQTKFYTLYILKRTKISDTLAVKDSIARFLQKDVKLVIEPAKP